MDFDVIRKRSISPVTTGPLAAMTQDRVAPATIINLTENEEVRCTFRPKEYAFTKNNEWTPGKVVGADMQPPRFNGGKPMTLTLELLFDTNEAPPGQQDVRLITNKLWKMMKTTDRRRDGDTKRSEPPHVEFRWGQSWSFKAVITSITQRFTLFMPDGTPVRSTVSVQFLQAEVAGQYPGQNPTSGGREGYAVHTVKEGETIDWIAFREYGNSNAWRHLAQANGLDDPGRLYPGQKLVLVPLQ